MNSLALSLSLGAVPADRRSSSPGPRRRLLSRQERALRRSAAIATRGAERRRLDLGQPSRQPRLGDK